MAQDSVKAVAHSGEGTQRLAQLSRLEQALGYDFSDIGLLDEATTHSSMGEGRSNERLEFLGDAVIGLIVGRMVFDRFPNDPEGVLTKKRSLMVRTQALAALADKLNLGQCLVVGKGMEMIGGRTNKHILEDCLEAVVGAVYLDGGFDAAGRVAESLFRESLEHFPEAEDELRDYKTELQEMVQAVAPLRISYSTVHMDGPPHNPYFTVELAIEGHAVCEGEGKSKKTAERNAARRAVEDFEGRVAPLIGAL